SVAGVEWVSAPEPALQSTRTAVPLTAVGSDANAVTSGTNAIWTTPAIATPQSPTGTTAGLPATADVPRTSNDFVAQTVSMIQSVPNGQEQHVMMRLDPPELGRVLVRIRRSAERLSVHIETDSARTLSVLREQH